MNKAFFLVRTERTRMRKITKNTPSLPYIPLTNIYKIILHLTSSKVFHVTHAESDGRRERANQLRTKLPNAARQSISHIAHREQPIYFCDHEGKVRGARADAGDRSLRPDRKTCLIGARNSSQHALPNQHRESKR